MKGDRVVLDGVSYDTPSYIPDSEIRIQTSMPKEHLKDELPKLKKMNHKKPFIIDYKTKNISFLQVSMDLAAQGIENSTFFLQLFDESLQGVDPFSPFLTEEQIYRVLQECTINPFYFLRECVRIPDQGSTGIAYQLNRANLASTFLFILNIDHYLVIPRQTGKTMSTIAILLWAYIFGTSASEFMFLNKSMEDANNNLGRLKQQRDLLPYYMRSMEAINQVGKLEKGINNVKSITNPVNGNKVVTKPSASSISKADNIGRGNTQPLQYYDEVEFTPFVRTIIQAAGPAFNTASRNARKNGGAYCRVFTSTPGDLDSQAGQDAQKIIETTATWDEALYDMSGADIKDYVKRNAKLSGIVYIQYNYRQLGYDEEWLDSVSRTLLYDQKKIKREVHLKRMHGSSLSPFDQDDLDALNDLSREARETKLMLGRFKIDIYDKIDTNKIYFIGIDCSSSIGRDSNAITIVDPYTEKPVAEYKSPYISGPDFTRLVYAIMKELTPRAVLCIERNHVGTILIQNLMETEFSQNIYYETADIAKIDDKLDGDGFLKYEAHNRKIRGIWTGPKSRAAMMKILESYVHEHKEKFVTKNITEDIGKLIYTRSGRIDHAPGSHDDSLMSYLMTLYVLQLGKSLHHFGYVRGLTEEDYHKGLIEEDNDRAYEVLNEIYGEGFFSKPKEANEATKEFNDNKYAAEMQRQNILNSLGSLSNTVKEIRMDDDTQSSIPMSFFDELND